MLTLDLQLQGQRHRDIKNGLSAPPKLTPATMLNLATKVSWGLEMLGTPRRFFGKCRRPCEGRDRPVFPSRHGRPRPSTRRSTGTGSPSCGGCGTARSIIKGIMDAEDAKPAPSTAGADAIVVSNHGGRQLDGALSSIRALEPVVEAGG